MKIGKINYKKKKKSHCFFTEKAVILFEIFLIQIVIETTYILMLFMMYGKGVVIIIEFRLKMTFQKNLEFFIYLFIIILFFFKLSHEVSNYFLYHQFTIYHSS